MRIINLSFQELNLDSRLLRAIETIGFSAPTEIQRQAVPVANEGRDIMASAQTGTGKTAAFVLPSLQRLLQPSSVQGRGPRVLVLTPTRELATQVTENIQQLGRFTNLRSGSIVGGVPYPPQERLLRKPLDLLVATPGRLLDHMKQGRVDFSRIELLILDEADRMLDMGFIEDVEYIASKSPKTRQTLLFSATLDGDIQRIATRILKNPALVQVSNVKQKHDSIAQRIHQVDDIKHKQALLSHLLQDPELTQAVVFTATKRAADQLADKLERQGHTSAALHGDMKQGARRRTVENMQRGKFRVLVATDVAARGLDIKGLSHVINFDLPMTAEDYIHRIGRTGRAGASGVAISLVGPEDWSNLVRIEKLTGHRLERHVVNGLEPSRPEPRATHAKPPQRHRPGGHNNRSSQKFNSEKRTVPVRFKNGNKPRSSNHRASQSA